MGTGIDMGNENLYKQVKEKLQQKVLTTESIDKNPDPNSQQYFKSFRKKADYIRKTMLGTQEQNLKYKWS